MTREKFVYQYNGFNQELKWLEKIHTLTKTNCVEEILTKMNKGGDVVITMPSRLFWEDNKLPANGYGQYYVPKWSVLVFTITINP
jgi:hypothetical protein